jgi:hypothetical protein
LSWQIRRGDTRSLRLPLLRVSREIAKQIHHRGIEDMENKKRIARQSAQ